MGIPKRQAAAHQIIGQIGRGGVALQGRPAHDLAVGLELRDHVGEGAQAVLQRVDGVEQGLLVLLVVLVVGQRLAFHQGQQADEMPEDAPGLPAHQFRHVGVFLLRHDGRTGAEGVRQVDEVELGGCPEDQFLGKPGQVHQDEAGAGGEFDGEVPVTDRVQRVAGGAVETQQAGGMVAVQRKGRPGQRGGPQRHDIDAPTGIP